MGSLRNPVGPLPSSIYWRRRIVVLSVIVLLALLITWIVTSGGGGGRNGADGSNGKHPAPSTITPGPSGSGPAISQHPGGRDGSGGSDSGGSGSGGSGSGSGAGSGSGSGTGSGGASGGSGGSGGSGAGSASGGGSAGTGVTVSEGGSGGGGGAAASLPAGSTLPTCTPSVVKLNLRSVHNTYAPGKTPTVELTAKNTSGHDCKIDLAPEHAVLTITKAGADDPFWASDDCPKVSGSRYYRVPADGTVTYTVRWDRGPSAPRCATPRAGSAGAGTYLVEVKVPGFEKARTSFVLSAD
ncbi:hypothetical protein ACFOOM_17005 [Streptomyces echinoruber]|uniref:DUF4232 domain-containing protein n=1 Tax=Streptomyces echinoruber TaxID=68898 RepID=A0A918R4P7_9ACTN|nr:hypothetical protein [Streptomyces echinoruber]GGZ85121.1 hypothetical protein GCM10010389_24130 [Streptomyces echinoruber]